MTDTTGTGTTKDAQIFFSYSRTDLPLAKPVLDALEAEGFSVWWDGLLEAGTVYTQTTETALENAKAVVVLWSKTSVDSHWVRDEAQSGRDTKRLVPLSIDGSMPPLGFRQFQCIDVSAAKGDRDHPAMHNALNAVRQLVEPGQPAAPISSHESPAIAGISRRKLMVGGGAVVLTGAAAFAAWQTGMLGSSGQSQGVNLAVLPFKNLSNDEDKNYFSEGLSEELRAALAEHDALNIVAQNSSSKAEEETTDTIEIAAKLGVVFVLRGSVRFAGDQLRISTQLIDGATGVDDWSETYDRTFADIFAVQTDIAQRVASALALTIPVLSGGEIIRIGSTNVPAALDAYLRGRSLYELASNESMDREALAQFDAAIEADPRYAIAWAAKSRVQTTLTNAYGSSDDLKRLYDESISSARRATLLEPKLAEAQVALGYVLLNGQLDVAGATTAYEKAYEHGQNKADILQGYATFIARSGDFDGAREAIARAMKLDPLNPNMLRTRGMIDFASRDFATAKKTIGEVLAANPDVRSANGWLGDIAYLEGDFTTALAYFEKEPSTLNRLRGLAIVHHALGNNIAAQKALADARAEFADNALYQEAEIYAQWGEKERAIKTLQDAYDAGDSGLVLARSDALLDPLRDDPRFIKLLSDIGFK